jgi:hypothetical protein
VTRARAGWGQVSKRIRMAQCSMLNPQERSVSSALGLEH